MYVCFVKVLHALSYINFNLCANRSNTTQQCYSLQCYLIVAYWRWLGFQFSIVGSILGVEMISASISFHYSLHTTYHLETWSSRNHHLEIIQKSSSRIIIIIYYWEEKRREKGLTKLHNFFSLLSKYIINYIISHQNHYQRSWKYSLLLHRNYFASIRSYYSLLFTFTPLRKSKIEIVKNSWATICNSDDVEIIVPHTYIHT